jgi:hypothetical protein
MSLLLKTPAHSRHFLLVVAMADCGTKVFRQISHITKGIPAQILKKKLKFQQKVCVF